VSLSSLSSLSLLSLLSLLFALCCLNVKPRLPGRRQDFELRKDVPATFCGAPRRDCLDAARTFELNFEKTCPLRSERVYVVTATSLCWQNR
jgi:hypothetical protein